PSSLGAVLRGRDIDAVYKFTPTRRKRMQRKNRLGFSLPSEPTLERTVTELLYSRWHISLLRRATAILHNHDANTTDEPPQSTAIDALGGCVAWAERTRALARLA